MSESQVISFAALRGHEAAEAFLRRCVAADGLAHSLLMAGPDGIGKRSLALAFTAWIHCDEKGADACGTCSSCRQIAAQSHPDLRVVSIPSGKKEIGVDHARDLKRWIALRSAAGGTKVAILLDAEMLTVAAQNALLKTLEEPPTGSIILVVTNNADALLATVRSRCQRVPIRPLSSGLVEEMLRQQGVPASLAPELARLSDGSPGRALAWRDILGKESSADLLAELATLSHGRYVRLAQMAASLNSPEASAVAKLDHLLRQYRDAALADSPAGTSVDEQRVLRRKADAVAATLSALRRTNPNRQLLFESLLLQIAPTPTADE